MVVVFFILFMLIIRIINGVLFLMFSGLFILVRILFIFFFSRLYSVFVLCSCLWLVFFVRLVMILWVVFILMLVISSCFFSFLNRLLLIFLLWNRLINLELRFCFVFSRLCLRWVKKFFFVGFFCF